MRLKQVKIDGILWLICHHCGEKFKGLTWHSSERYLCDKCLILYKKHYYPKKETEEKTSMNEENDSFKKAIEKMNAEIDKTMKMGRKISEFEFMWLEKTLKDLKSVKSESEIDHNLIREAYEHGDPDEFKLRMDNLRSTISDLSTEIEQLEQIIESIVKEDDENKPE